jgi:hypothetical protein
VDEFLDQGSDAFQPFLEARHLADAITAKPVFLRRECSTIPVVIQGFQKRGHFLFGGFDPWMQEFGKALPQDDLQNGGMKGSMPQGTLRAGQFAEALFTSGELTGLPGLKRSI